MPYLDTLLAYAVTMLFVATVVTQVVRMLQRLLKVRQAEFGRLMEDFLTKAVHPMIDRELDRVRALNPADGGPLPTTESIKKGIGDALHAIGIRTTHISTAELLEEVKHSMSRWEPLKTLEDHTQQLLGDLGRSFERIGQTYTEKFRKNSRRWATVVAIVLALALNIDSIHILRSYYTDTATRTAVLASVEDAVAKQESLMKNGGIGTVTYEGLRKDVGAIRADLESLSAGPVPLGWSLFPYGADTFPNGEGTWSLVQRILLWLAGIMITGFLGGMGAPFWYDVILGLRRVTDQARSGK